jgi:hypothetical protein
MRILLCILFLFAACPWSEADVFCDRNFNALEELRISSFASAAVAPDLQSCNEVAQNFLKNAGTPPHGCKNAKALIKDWSDSYNSDTQETLSSDPKVAYASIKQWAYETLKTKCAKRQFN